MANVLPPLVRFHCSQTTAKPDLSAENFLLRGPNRNRPPGLVGAGNPGVPPSQACALRTGSRAGSANRPRQNKMAPHPGSHRPLRAKFLPGRFTSSQMTFGFIDFQNFFHLIGQAGIDFGQAFGNVFVDRTLRYPKHFRGIANRRSAFENVISDIHHTLPDMVFHRSGPFLPPKP